MSGSVADAGSLPAMRATATAKAKSRRGGFCCSSSATRTRSEAGDAFPLDPDAPVETEDAPAETASGSSPDARADADASDRDVDDDDETTANDGSASADDPDEVRIDLESAAEDAPGEERRRRSAGDTDRDVPVDVPRTPTTPPRDAEPDETTRLLPKRDDDDDDDEANRNRDERDDRDESDDRDDASASASASASVSVSVSGKGKRRRTERRPVPFYRKPFASAKALIITWTTLATAATLGLCGVVFQYGTPFPVVVVGPDGKALAASAGGKHHRRHRGGFDGGEFDVGFEADVGVVDGGADAANASPRERRGSKRSEGKSRRGVSDETRETGDDTDDSYSGDDSSSRPSTRRSGSTSPGSSSSGRRTGRSSKKSASDTTPSSSSSSSSSSRHHRRSSKSRRGSASAASAAELGLTDLEAEGLCAPKHVDATHGVYRQHLAECGAATSARAAAELGCVAGTSCQLCYLSGTPAETQRNSMAWCRATVCERHGAEGCAPAGSTRRASASAEAMMGAARGAAGDAYAYEYEEGYYPIEDDGGGRTGANAFGDRDDDDGGGGDGDGYYLARGGGGGGGGVRLDLDGIGGFMSGVAAPGADDGVDGLLASVMGGGGGGGFGGGGFGGGGRVVVGGGDGRVGARDGTRVSARDGTRAGTRRGGSVRRAGPTPRRRVGGCSTDPGDQRLGRFLFEDFSCATGAGDQVGCAPRGGCRFCNTHGRSDLEEGEEEDSLESGEFWTCPRDVCKVHNLRWTLCDPA